MEHAMAFIPVANTVQIELIYSIEGQVCENVMHFLGATPADSVTLLALANNAFNMWTSTFKVVQNVNCHLSRIKATDISSESGAVYEMSPAENNSGLVSGDLLPANCALVMSLKTAKRGRGYRGRIYVPGMNEQQTAGSYWNAAVIETTTDWYDFWDFLDSDGEPYALSVSHRYNHGVPLTSGTGENVTSMIANPVVGSQRRRLPGRGR